MIKKTTNEDSKSRVVWENLEDWARLKIQSWIQQLLEEEVTELLGRKRYERKGVVDCNSGSRNGYGKPRE